LLAASLAHDPLAPVRSEKQTAAVDARLEKLAEHVRTCE
jgi:hypothetical protein